MFIVPYNAAFPAVIIFDIMLIVEQLFSLLGLLAINYLHLLPQNWLKSYTLHPTHYTLQPNQCYVFAKTKFFTSRRLE